MGFQALVAFAADTSVPSDVEGLVALPGDSEVTLEWDPATDDIGVTGYYVYSGLTSVSEDGGSYTFGETDTGDNTTYVMDGLTNDVTYYFTVTAYDAAGNESEYYSNEAEATPVSAEIGDFTAPTVTNAEALTGTMVELEFSEEVILPDNPASAFSIESSEGKMLEIFDAYISDDDSNVVFIITDGQTAGAQYILTAGLSISDAEGNPIESGTSDTAVFTGSSLTKSEDTTEEDTDEDGEDSAKKSESSDDFSILEIEATEIDEIEVELSEAATSATDAFTIQLLDDASVEIEILKVEINEEDPTLITIKTDEMAPGFEYVLSVTDDLLNKNGESIAEDSREVEFVAKTIDLADLIAPEDVTDFLADALDETTVSLTWEESEDSAGDLAEYLIYKSLDGGLSFSDAIEVAKELTELEIDGLTPGAAYTFKITATDESGNESEGKMTTVTLPESGPGLIALGALSMLGAGIIRRKKF